MSSSIHPSQTQPAGSPSALPSETPAERWNRIQEACDSLLIQNPDIEKNTALAKSPSEMVAPLGAIERWTKAALDELFKEQTQKSPIPSNPVTVSPSNPQPQKAPAAPEPAFLSADPRMRAALHRLHEKTIDAAKNRLRPGSKLIRPGLEGFHQDALPVIESSDIKLNANDTQWRSPQEPTTRVLRDSGNGGAGPTDH